MKFHGTWSITCFYNQLLREDVQEDVFGISSEIPGAELAKAPCLGKEKQVLFWAIEESSILTGCFLVSGPHLNV